jgi:hypothetical protein
MPRLRISRPLPPIPYKFSCCEQGSFNFYYKTNVLRSTVWRELEKDKQWLRKISPVQAAFPNSHHISLYWQPKLAQKCQNYRFSRAYHECITRCLSSLGTSLAVVFGGSLHTNLAGGLSLISTNVHSSKTRTNVCIPGLFMTNQTDTTFLGRTISCVNWQSSRHDAASREQWRIYGVIQEEMSIFWEVIL